MKRSRFLPGQLNAINRDATATALSLHAGGHDFFILSQTPTRFTMFKNIRSFIAAAILLAQCAAAAHADIYQWEYINPNEPSVGKALSATLAPDGAGANAVPGADLHSRNLTMAYLGNKDLHGANAQLVNLTDAYLYNANLSNVDLANANLTGADLGFTNFLNTNFAGAIIKNANFSLVYNSTASQLYSTASYANGDLSGIGLSFRDLTGLNLANQNLAGSNFQSATVTNVNFTNANLTGADFEHSTLTNANFTGATIKGTNFFFAMGPTAGQLTSTGSYANGDLSGIRMDNTDLTGVNFANQNLTNNYLYNVNLTSTNFTNANLSNASFVAGSNLTNATLVNANLVGTSLQNANVTNANFTGANIRGADFYADTFTAGQLYSTASYAAHDLSGMRVHGVLTGWSFANQNLTGAYFPGSFLTNTDFTNANLTNANLYESSLTNSNFTGAIVKGADLSYATDFTATQLASTASYTHDDLSGIKLSNLDLTGWNFANQNLAGANFDSSLLTNSNFTAADLRGAFWSPGEGSVTHNAIQPEGTIQGLALLTGEKLVIHNSSIPIKVSSISTFQPGSELQILIEGDAWSSTISFAPGIPVALGGTLDLNFTSGMSLAGQVGRTFDLFDWTGVSPTSAFTVSSPYTWNITNLYTTGEVTLLAIPGLQGDFNHDGTVDATDYVVWRKTGGSPADYNAWRTHFGQTAFNGSSLRSAGPLSAAVPEPASAALVMFGLVLTVACRCRRSKTLVPAHAKSAIIMAFIVVASTSNLAPAHAASITSLGFDGVPHGVINDGSLVVGERSYMDFFSGYHNEAIAWRAIGGLKTLGNGAARAAPMVRSRRSAEQWNEFFRRPTSLPPNSLDENNNRLARPASWSF